MFIIPDIFFLYLAGGWVRRCGMLSVECGVEEWERDGRKWKDADGKWDLKVRLVSVEGVQKEG